MRSANVISKWFVARHVECRAWFYGRHSHDCAKQGKDVAVAWFSIKPDPPYWMDEPFSESEVKNFLKELVDLLRERGCVTHCSGFSLLALKGVSLKHPDWPKVLSISPRETPVLGERRYEVEVLILGPDRSVSSRSVVMSTDGPDTPVTPERLLGQLAEKFFLPSLE